MRKNSNHNRTAAGSRALTILAAAALISLQITALSACGTTDTEAARSQEETLNNQMLAQKDGTIYDYRVIDTLEHGRSSFTEGLAVEGGHIYEGTGLYGQSELLKSDASTGILVRKRALDSGYFGEGVTVLGGEIFQLTYMENTCFVYDEASLELQRSFEYPSQGWGLTNDGGELIMSDGSSTLTFMDPVSHEQTRFLPVTDNQGAVSGLNELEYIEGEIYANIWKTSLIAVISPQTGTVTGWIDLAGLNPNPVVLKDPYVLNGIAYDRTSGRILVTGKCWPNIFEIELEPRSTTGS